MVIDRIEVRNAKEHNLCGLDLDLPKNQLIVITGLSGSGKSSLAFDTIYAEGQRRYVESLSSYARQFLDLHSKPNVESITGLSPAISISQKSISKNPRSTVSTITEIYDYLRLMYARIGTPYSPFTGKPIVKQTVSQMVDVITALPQDTKFYILAPVVRGRKGEYFKEIINIRQQGYTRLKIDNIIYEIDNLPKLDKNQRHDISVLVDRVVLTDSLDNRIPSSIESALRIGSGIVHVEIVEVGENSEFINGQILIFSENFSCPESGFAIEKLEPRLFSFNSPYGACVACDGLGKKVGINPALIVPDENLSIAAGALEPVGVVNVEQLKRNSASYFQRYCINALIELSKVCNFDLNVPWSQLDRKVQEMIIFGLEAKEITIKYTNNDGRCIVNKIIFEGIMNLLEGSLKEKYVSLNSCHECSGYRLNQQSLSVRIAGMHIGELVRLSVSAAKTWFQELSAKLDEQQNKIAEKIISEIINRLVFLQNVGLDYLSLDRESATLSGGEAQRIRLASQIGSGLTGVLYVLDEPSIGLHQCDNERLIMTLKNLRDIGNTVIVVEHDEDTIMSADYVVDIGPGAGNKGGRVIACGTPEEVKQNKNSITGKYLSGELQIQVPQQRRPSTECIRVIGACENNLKNIDVQFPLSNFVCVTGISGSGKSTLVIDTLYRYIAQKKYGSSEEFGKCKEILGIENIDKVIEIDQSPIGRTPLSNPATYIGLFTHIRTWFAGLPESKSRGYTIGRFSFNAKGGRCEACKGDGVIKIEMHFLPDIYVQCDQCRGLRYNRETLEILYKGQSISDVLNMTVDQAAEFFENLPLIKEKLESLQSVGMGYIKIGQSSTTLSGGEAQRIKLSKELSKRATGKTLYILDEPTTGLHFEDIKNLLKVLHKLADLGNTIIVIEHNLHLIKTADYIIDVGPSGGINGGRIIATGTPEEIVCIPESITGRYLRPYLCNTI